jgi:hypothetical protein
MGIFFDTTKIVAIRLLRFFNDAWFLEKERLTEQEANEFLRNPTNEFRVEYGYGGTTTHNGGAEQIVWIPATPQKLS